MSSLEELQAVCESQDGEHHYVAPIDLVIRALVEVAGELRVENRELQERVGRLESEVRRWSKAAAFLGDLGSD